MSATWVESQLATAGIEPSPPLPSPAKESLSDYVLDGRALCLLTQALDPSSSLPKNLQRSLSKPSMFYAMERVQYFIKWCRTNGGLGEHNTFTTVHLFDEKNDDAVLGTLKALQKRYGGAIPPPAPVKEAESPNTDPVSSPKEPEQEEHLSPVQKSREKTASGTKLNDFLSKFDPNASGTSTQRTDVKEESDSEEEEPPVVDMEEEAEEERPQVSRLRIPSIFSRKTGSTPSEAASRPSLLEAMTSRRGSLFSRFQKKAPAEETKPEPSATEDGPYPSPGTPEDAEASTPLAKEPVKKPSKASGGSLSDFLSSVQIAQVGGEKKAQATEGEAEDASKGSRLNAFLSTSRPTASSWISEEDDDKSKERATSLLSASSWVSEEEQDGRDRMTSWVSEAPDAASPHPQRMSAKDRKSSYLSTTSWVSEDADAPVRMARGVSTTSWVSEDMNAPSRVTRGISTTSWLSEPETTAAAPSDDDALLLHEKNEAIRRMAKDRASLQNALSLLRYNVQNGGADDTKELEDVLLLLHEKNEAIRRMDQEKKSLQMQLSLEKYKTTTNGQVKEMVSRLNGLEAEKEELALQLHDKNQAIRNMEKHRSELQAKLSLSRYNASSKSADSKEEELALLVHEKNEVIRQMEKHRTNVQAQASLALYKTANPSAKSKEEELTLLVHEKNEVIRAMAKRLNAVQATASLATYKSASGKVESSGSKELEDRVAQLENELARAKDTADAARYSAQMAFQQRDEMEAQLDALRN